MKYSLVLAALSAAAIATPYVNVEVSEDAIVETSHGVRHQHRGRDHYNHNNGGWWSGLWSGRDRSQNGRNDRDDRRDDREDRRDDRRNNGRRDGRDDRNRGRFDVDGMIDDMFGSHYECILNGRTNRDERRDTEHCCERSGGELYGQRGHCIFRDAIRNPRDEWRDCAMEQRNAEFAECYDREAREIEDELEHRGEHSRDNRDGRNHRDNRHVRNGDRTYHNHDDHRDDRDDRHYNRDDRRDDRNDRHRMIVQNDNDFNNGGRNSGRHGRDDRRNDDERFQCRVDLEDQNKREEITRNCCENEAQGRFDNFDRTCDVKREENRERFEMCAREQGAQNTECRRDRD